MMMSTSPVARRPRHWLLRRTPTDIAYLVIVFQTVVSLVVSPLPQRSLQAVWPHALGLVLYYLIVRWTWTPRQLRWAWWGVVASGVGIAGLGFLGMLAKPQVLFPALKALLERLQSLVAPVVARIPDSFHPNVVAGAVLLTFPFLVLLGAANLRASGPHGALRRVALACAVLIVLPTLALTQSRAAYLGALAAVALIVVLRRPRWLWGAVPLALAAAAIGGMTKGWRPLAEALVSSDPTFGIAWRVDVWRVSRLMVGDFCFTGVGFGCFEPVQWLLYPLASGGTAPHAHNLFLQVAVDLGLPGAAAYALLILSIVVQGVKRLRRAPGADASDPQLPMLVASLAAITAMLTQGLLDAAVWGNKGAFLPWVVMGLGAALAAGGPHNAAEAPRPAQV
jgi:putative inorganic carbon (HCO3(-)) transporter